MSDWKETCAKCMDGDIEPRQCEYYGEPNGCNSPSYGQHPTTEKSSAVGNAAAMREALIWMKERIIAAIHDGSLDCSEVMNKIEEALEKPARNCDVGTPEEQSKRLAKHCERFHRCNGCPCCGKVKYNRCEYFWAQMPYTAKEGETDGV